MTDSAAAGDLLAVGRIGRPHGLDGSFKVTQPRERVLADAKRLVLDGREVEIVRHDGTPAEPILRLRGMTSREAVEAVRGHDLYVPRAEAPPLEEDEWLAEDLVGCRVVEGGQKKAPPVGGVEVRACGARKRGTRSAPRCRRASAILS